MTKIEEFSYASHTIYEEEHEIADHNVYTNVMEILLVSLGLEVVDV